MTKTERRRNRTGEYIISPNSKNKEKLKELRKSIAVSASDGAELTRTILPPRSYGTTVLQLLRSGKMKIRADLKDQIRIAEESEKI